MAQKLLQVVSMCEHNIKLWAELFSYRAIQEHVASPATRVVLGNELANEHLAVLADEEAGPQD